MNNRRDFLKTSLVGAGACAFSPAINAFGAQANNNAIPKRFVFIRKSNGIMPQKYILPTFSNSEKTKDENKTAFEVSLDKHELPAWMEDLHPFKEHMTILQGLSCKMSEIGHKCHQSIMAALNSNNNTLSSLKRRSVDFELDHLFPSPVGHVEASFARDRHGVVEGFSIPAPFTRNFCYADPITAYKNLFKSIINPSLVKSENSMLAFLSKDHKTEASTLPGGLKTGYQNYSSSMESVYSKNDTLSKMTDQIKKNMPDKDLVFNLGKRGASTIERQDAMTEVLVSALITGMTNVVTYTIDDLETEYTGLEGIENTTVNLHNVGHNKGNAGKSPQELRELVRRQHIKQIKTFINRLKAQPEGEGNMFDNTMIMYFPEAGEGHHVAGIEPPFLIMSGKNCRLDIAGRYIRLPFYKTQGHQTLGNWYTTLLNAHGNNIKHYGDLDGYMVRKKIPQKGPIKRFIKA